MEQSSSEESAFPKEFDKCPACGCTETLESRAVQEAISEGKLHQDAVPAWSTSVILLVGPLGPIGIYAPSLIKKLANCDNCGVSYCVKAGTKGQPVGPNGQVTQIDARL